MNLYLEFNVGYIQTNTYNYFRKREDMSQNGDIEGFAR